MVDIGVFLRVAGLSESKFHYYSFDFLISSPFQEPNSMAPDRKICKLLFFGGEGESSLAISQHIHCIRWQKIFSFTLLFLHNEAFVVHRAPLIQCNNIYWSTKTTILCSRWKGKNSSKWNRVTVKRDERKRKKKKKKN